MLHGSRGDDGEKLAGIEWSSERMSPYTVSALTSYVANFALEVIFKTQILARESAQPVLNQKRNNGVRNEPFVQVFRHETRPTSIGPRK